jgi:hypothetical protein
MRPVQATINPGYATLTLVAGQQLVASLRAILPGRIAMHLARLAAQASRNGCTARQPFSMLSARWNRVWSVRQS